MSEKLKPDEITELFIEHYVQLIGRYTELIDQALANELGVPGPNMGAKLELVQLCEKEVVAGRDVFHKIKEMFAIAFEEHAKGLH